MVLLASPNIPYVVTLVSTNVRLSRGIGGSRANLSSPAPSQFFCVDVFNDSSLPVCIFSKTNDCFAV